MTEPTITPDQIKAAAERIVSRIESAGTFFYCDADRAEACAIAREEIVRLWTGTPPDTTPKDCALIAEALEAKVAGMSSPVANLCRRLAAVLREPGFGEALNG